MDSFTAASTFAAIVGLISQFRQEKGANATLDHRSFVEWLEYHRHEELKNLISNTAALRTEVDNILHSEHEQMIQKLDEIGKVLGTLLSRLGEFGGLTAMLTPNNLLSEQAFSILKQFVESGGKEFMLRKWIGPGSPSLTIVSGGDGNLDSAVTQKRFLEDDLDALVGLGLLSMRYGSTGEPHYCITRNAVRFVEAGDGKVSA
jgi:hypothetical protein